LFLANSPLDADESFTPSRGLTEALLQQARDAVSRLRAVVKERVDAPPKRRIACKPGGRARKRRSFCTSRPELKESFSSAATAVKTLAKEQAEAFSTEENALGKIKSQLTAFRVK
jgi:hypothetical protein